MDAKLAAIIVHDIKNSLGVLEGELRVLAAESPDERAGHAHLTCLTLQEKLIGFLTLYKASSQGLTAQIEAWSPQDFLEGLLRHLTINQSGLEVTINSEGMPLVAFFDENLVGLALEAALQNATRFARSRIELACRKDGNGVIFSIRDDGPGIGTHEVKPSTGLGMGLCKAIAAAHHKGDKNGEARLADHPDGGAQFELHIP
ncbi:histidine kinase [Herbaspirillum hiltneri N3]|uniref:histidine kinase n=1 Tax=Herbaspirillum hiltneri N3 TaxID=1262470 RepID=A0ABM5UYQ5_9BURK|nr:HAMP domain-containing sensor histidine kinase [Herbaspirillum hiltneri]AKZ62379.1 histidine kinase [Herbaspirillum hiltneri N3]